MSIQPPNIDNRNYEDIVAQTIRLVQHSTAQNDSELVENQAEFLLDRTLAQDITDTNGNIITSGTLIDEKIAEKISEIASLKQVNLKLKGWYKQPIESDTKNPKSKIENPKSNDAGLALIRIFGRMAATVSDRLNRVPEKNFLAFLDLLGTQILPPQPARVPLTFYLASGIPENTTALVPAYTQISSPPAEGEEEVVFETESDLLVTPVRLQAVFVRQYSEDKYSDRTSQATGKEDAAFWAFTGDTAIEHFLYLASDLFTLPAHKTVTINVASSNTADWNKLSLAWSYWDGTDWQLLTPTPTNPASTNPVTFANFPAINPHTVNGFKAAWLRVKLLSSLTASPQIDRITATVHIERNDSNPDRCFFNTIPIDLSKDFYPFGEQPRFNDTFYIALDKAFAKPNAKVKVDVKLSNLPPLPVNPSDDLEIKWETWNGKDWDSLTSSFSDLTNKFTQDGKVSFTLPPEVAAKTINGETSYWVRVRITKGNYGKEGSYKLRTYEKGLTQVNTPSKSGDNKILVKKTEGFLPGSIIWIGIGQLQEINEIESISNNTNELTLKTKLVNPHDLGTSVVGFVYDLTLATFGPPSLQSLKLSYIYDNSAPLSACLTYNDFTYLDRTLEASKDDSSFSPFTRTDNEQPSLYLGFDRPFPNRSIALYFQVETPTATELSETTTNATKPRLVWEYFNGKDWMKLNAIDETAAFSDRGLIKFIGPSDFTATQEFNQTLYWLRVRGQSDGYRVPPRLRRILTNTIWASQTTTLHDEILGGSNGNPNQTFRTVQSPILPGQQLEVQEQKIPPTEEQQEIEKLEGKAAITIDRDEKGEIETVWVRWHEVADFYESGRRDRHYKINRLTGEIQFGDGQYGLIPPQGRNNIRMKRYKTDGGTKGNKLVDAINQLKTTIPYIDRVTNLEAAAGGSDRESIDRVKERGQKFIRHRNRAVTVQDFEDLAYEASPDIARVKAIAPIFEPLAENLWLEPKNPNFSLENHQKLIKNQKTNPGLVKLFIVPGNDSPQPIPSLALIDRVENYICDRASPTLSLWVGSPQWLKVSVTAEVVPTSLEFADVVRNAVIQRLETFLHPLTGGVSGQGWEFGREPHLSDLYALIESIDRVDYVRSLSVKIDPEPPKPPELFLIFSGSHDVSLFLSDIGG
jgi:Baseplate J-like protein